MTRLLRALPLDSRSLGTATILLVLGMLAACLWPFESPRNTVSWSSDGRGISFGRYGVLLRSDPIAKPGNSEAADASLELWLQPGSADNTGSILAIDSVANPRQFTVDQWRDALALRSASVGDPIREGGAPCFTPDVFTPGKTVFVTVTSDERGTEVYVDGLFRKLTPSFRITNRMLSGRLIAGTGAVSDDTWLGQMRGLAIYGHAFSPASVLQHYTSWSADNHPPATDLEDPLALYLFDEGMGRHLRNQVHGGSGIEIPDRYLVPSKTFLSSPSLDNPQDIILNVIGFVPLGFTLCGYLICSRRTRMPFSVTVVICGAFSLLVESLQIFLPTRDSSMTDVITNILGAAVGAHFSRPLKTSLTKS